MRNLIFLAYSFGAIAVILYAALPFGGHVTGNPLTSMLGGWGYAVIYAVISTVVYVVLKPARPGTLGRAAAAFVLTGLLAAGVLIFISPAPMGHMALTIALAGLAALMLLFSFAAIFGKAS